MVCHACCSRRTACRRKLWRRATLTNGSCVVVRELAEDGGVIEEIDANTGTNQGDVVLEIFNDGVREVGNVLNG